MAQRFTAKVFPNGGSQAIRLPKECRVVGDEVTIVRDGSRLIIEPKAPRRWSAKAEKLLFSGTPDPDLFPDREQPPMQDRPDLEKW